MTATQLHMIGLLLTDGLTVNQTQKNLHNSALKYYLNLAEKHIYKLKQVGGRQCIYSESLYIFTDDINIWEC